MISLTKETRLIGRQWFRIAVIQVSLLPPEVWMLLIGLQFKKLFTYYKAVQMNQPHWNGFEWVDYQDLDEIPF